MVLSFSAGGAGSVLDMCILADRYDVVETFFHHAPLDKFDINTVDRNGI